MAFASPQEANASLAAYLAPQRDRQLERMTLKGLKTFFIVGALTMSGSAPTGRRLSRRRSIPILFLMQDNDENDSILCVGDCNFVVGRETRQGKEGRLLIEMVERCTRCGYVFARTLVSDRFEKN